MIPQSLIYGPNTLLCSTSSHRNFEASSFRTKYHEIPQFYIVHTRNSQIAPLGMKELLKCKKSRCFENRKALGPIYLQNTLLKPRF